MPRPYFSIVSPIFLCLLVVLVAVPARPTPTFAQSATPPARPEATRGATAIATIDGVSAPHTVGAPCGSDAAVAAPVAPLVPAAAGTGPAQVGAAQGIVYKFGLTPWQKGQSEDDVRFLFKPMLEWLGKAVGATFVLVGAKDYQQASQFLANNTVQFANISPSPFVVAQQHTPGIRMLVTELSCHKATNTVSDSYRGYILALKSRTDLNSVEDLQGKKFAFVSEESTSGFVVPNALLFTAHNRSYREYFAKTFFLGSHPLVTDAIAAGSVDAGATWDFNWSQAIQKHQDVFKALWTSPPIPNVGIAVHPSVPEAVQQQVQDALLRIDPRLLQGLSPLGYVARPDSFYDVIRQLEAAK